jgi:hypothetical protein
MGWLSGSLGREREGPEELRVRERERLPLSTPSSPFILPCFTFGEIMLGDSQVKFHPPHMTLLYNPM